MRRVIVLTRGRSNDLRIVIWSDRTAPALPSYERIDEDAQAMRSQPVPLEGTGLKSSIDRRNIAVHCLSSSSNRY